MAEGVTIPPVLKDIPSPTVIVDYTLVSVTHYGVTHAVLKKLVLYHHSRCISSL